MKPRFSFYKSEDFGRVYHFLRSREENDYLAYERIRFQFCMGLHTYFVENGLQGGFERTCGLWEDEYGIVSLVLTEGATIWGETFFVFRDEADKTPELMGRMCDFAERFTSKPSDDGQHNFYKVCIQNDDMILTDFLQKRGYKKTDHRQRIMAKTYSNEPEEVVLPKGFIIKDGRTVSPFYTALAHNHSFRYIQKNDGGEKGFEKIRAMPDYRPELDLVLFDSEGQPAGIAIFWINERSKTAILEPMGTVWWYRKMGLGKALLIEGINRTRNYGCSQVIGGDQPFYWQMGFESKKEHYMWSWTS